MDISHVNRCLWRHYLGKKKDAATTSNSSPQESSCPRCNFTFLRRAFGQQSFISIPHPACLPPLPSSPTKWGQQHQCQVSAVRVALLRAASPLAIPCARPEVGTEPGDTGERARRASGRGRPSFQETGVLVTRYKLRGFRTHFFFLVCFYTGTWFSQIFVYSFV